MSEKTPARFVTLIQPCEPSEVQAHTASGEPLASDVCVGVWLDGRLVGWGDDYGTFRLLPAPSSAGRIEDAGEELLDAAGRFWELCQR